MPIKVRQCLYEFIQLVAVPPKKPPSDDKPQGFRVEASLPLTESTPVIPHDTARFCWLYSVGLSDACRCSF